MTVTAREWNASLSASSLLRNLGLYAMEMSVFLIFFGVYVIARGAADPSVADATANARRIIDLEQSLGVFREAGWQHAALPHSWLMDIANFTYMYLHVNLLLVAGFFFFVTDKRKYRVIRNALLLAAFIGVPFYHLYPVTPPRLLAQSGIDYGFFDSLAELRRPRPGGLANWYAAIPSYHFGWILLMTIGAWWCWKSVAIRIAAVAFLALMWWSIVVTANHYFFDMVLGGAICAATFAAAYTFERWADRKPPSLRRVTRTVQNVRLPF